MQVWKSEKKIVGDVEVSGGRAWKATRISDPDGDYDPRDWNDRLNWFMMWKRRAPYENDGDRSLDGLIGLIAKREKELGVPAEKSFLAETLPDGSENPRFVSAEEIRKGYGTNVARACHELGILVSPVFMYEHGGASFSDHATDPWDSGQVGFVWTPEKMGEGEFGKLVKETMDDLTSWWNDEIYQIDVAEVNPKTGELLSGWEYAGETVLGKGNADRAISGMIKEDVRPENGLKA